MTRKVAETEQGSPRPGEGADARRAELEDQISTLEEIRAHREWVIDGLRQHIKNIEELRDRAESRVRGLEEHVANLEEDLERARDRVAGLEEHTANLEESLADCEARIAGALRLPPPRSPRLEALFRLAESIWAEREDLQARFLDARVSDFWYWIMWHGPTRYPELAQHLYPRPGRYLRDRVVGEVTSDEGYFQGGLVDWNRMQRCLRRGGFHPEDGGHVLDFGVGCGRILQFFSLHAGTCQLVGADVDQEAVEWCRKHLDFAAFEKLPMSPPSPFADECFSAVYAFSVFSHLPEDLHRAWLEDLARITRPGGTLVLTVQGLHVARRILAGGQRSGLGKVVGLRSRMGELEETGFAFFPYRELRFQDSRNVEHFADWDLDRYGSTFILEPYVRRRWTDLFELIAYEEAPDDWQDYVILRRR